VEVERILKAPAKGTAAWGFNVLNVPQKDRRELSAVSKAYRNMMRLLHPDKVGQDDRVQDAIEAVRKAKDICERSLSSITIPYPPRELHAQCINDVKGKRRFKLTWQAPVVREQAPVRRYVVAAVDPAYGKALTITILEPDYNQELRRFVGVEDLTSYVLAEEELEKMPMLWQKPTAQVQIAAANEAGQSTWANLRVQLNAKTAPAPAPPPVNSNTAASGVKNYARSSSNISNNTGFTGAASNNTKSYVGLGKPGVGVAAGAAGVGSHYFGGGAAATTNSGPRNSSFLSAAEVERKRESNKARLLGVKSM